MDPEQLWKSATMGQRTAFFWKVTIDDALAADRVSDLMGNQVEKRKKTSAKHMQKDVASLDI